MVLWWYVLLTQVLLAAASFHTTVMRDENIAGRYIGCFLWLVLLVPLFILLWSVRP